MNKVCPVTVPHTDKPGGKAVRSGGHHTLDLEQRRWGDRHSRFHSPWQNPYNTTEFSLQAHPKEETELVTQPTHWSLLYYLGLLFLLSIGVFIPLWHKLRWVKSMHLKVGCILSPHWITSSLTGIFILSFSSNAMIWHYMWALGTSPQSDINVRIPQVEVKLEIQCCSTVRN